MPKKYRLTGPELRKLSGKRSHGTFFSLLAAPLRTSHAKCACVVSKKTSRKAVERNKVQRRCRAALSKRIPDVKKPLALVLYAKSNAKEAGFSEIDRDIERLLAKL